MLRFRVRTRVNIGVSYPELSMGWVGSLVVTFWWVWLGRWLERFPKIEKLIRHIYYVCNLYETVCFVNLQFDASLVQ